LHQATLGKQLLHHRARENPDTVPRHDDVDHHARIVAQINRARQAGGGKAGARNRVLHDLIQRRMAGERPDREIPVASVGVQMGHGFRVGEQKEVDRADRNRAQRRVRDPPRPEDQIGAPRQYLLDQVCGQRDLDFQRNIGQLALQLRNESGQAARRRDLARADTHDASRFRALGSTEDMQEAGDQRLALPHQMAPGRGKRHCSSVPAEKRPSHHVFQLANPRRYRGLGGVQPLRRRAERTQPGYPQQRFKVIECDSAYSHRLSISQKTNHW
jgi:hypothetical protein